MPSERPKATTLALATILSAAAVLPFAGPTSAEEPISIPVSGVYRGEDAGDIVHDPADEEMIDEMAPTVTLAPTAPAGPAVESQPVTTPVAPSTTATTAIAFDVAKPRASTTPVAPAGPRTAQLPRTGSQTWSIVGAGLTLAGAGLALVRGSRRTAG